MTIAVDLGYKATKHTNKAVYSRLEVSLLKSQSNGPVDFRSQNREQDPNCCTVCNAEDTGVDSVPMHKAFEIV